MNNSDKLLIYNKTLVDDKLKINDSFDIKVW